MGVEGLKCKGESLSQITLRQTIVILEDKISHFGYGVLGHSVLVGEETILASFSPLFWLSFLKEGRREGK